MKLQLKNFLLLNFKNSMFKVFTLILLFLSLISFLPISPSHSFMLLIKPKKDANHEKYKTECLEILTEISQKFLANQTSPFEVSSLSQDDKKLLYTYFTYFILTDFCFIHLRDYIFDEKTKINLSEIEKDQNQNVLYVITANPDFLLYYIQEIQNIESIKSKILQNKYCNNSNNLKELASCLYENSIFIHNNKANIPRLILPLHTLFKNKIKFIHLRVNLYDGSNNNELIKLLREIERSNKKYNVCFIYTKPEHFHANIKLISIPPFITIYCPSFHLEKDFPNKYIPTFNISYHHMVTTNLSLNLSNKEHIINLSGKIFQTSFKNPNEKYLTFYDNETTFVHITKNIEKSTFYSFNNQKELFNFYLDRLLYQFVAIEEITTWLRKEMAPRNILPATP